MLYPLRRCRSLGSLIALSWMAAACGPRVLSGGGLDEVAPSEVGGQGGAGGGAIETPPEGPPVVAFTAPADKSQTEAELVRFEGTASGKEGIASVFVRVGPNVPLLAQSGDNFKTWWIEAKVPPGAFVARAIAYDTGGVPSAEAQLALTRLSTAPDSAAPTVKILTPPDGSTPPQATVLVTGETGDDRGVVAMELRRNGELLTERPVETDNFFATWARLVTLLPSQDNVLVFTAIDAAGNKGEATITLKGVASLDTEAPQVTVTSPKGGAKLAAEEATVTGSAFDNEAVAQVKVRVGVVAGGQVSWGPYEKATTSDGFAQWTTVVKTPPGAIRLQARAIDVSGLAQVAELDLDNNYVPEWSDEELIPLRIRDDEPAATASLELDRDGINAIMNEQIQRDTLLLDLDPTTLLTSSLDQIKVACGTAWKNDNSNPQHNCSQTPLGQTFKGADGTWQSSAEYALVRLLTMTPANVVVKGTSIAGLQGIADGAILGIKIGGGFNQVLAETLGIPRTQEIVTTPSAAKALRTEWMMSHPNLAAGTIPVTLYDAMNDLAPLGATLGPAGDHPGVVDPAQPPSSKVFGDDFKMLLEATSNLRWRDGIDLSKGKDYIAVVEDKKGPTFDDVLEFDFEDPAKFDVLGLVPSPVVDLRLKILENSAFIPSCAGNNGCKSNLPGAPTSPQSIWAQPGWQLERIITEAARNDYKSRVFENCLIDFLGCQARVAVGKDGDPPAWTKFDILFNLGDPPKDQYLWELINEVAQVALHNFGTTKVPEGQANVAFTLQDVPVGLTAEQIRQAVRPYLQQQSGELSKGLLGDYAKNNGAVDFFYLLGADGAPYLFFIAPGDPRPISAYSYSAPGFFDDKALSVKASSTADGGSGDTAHEKLKLAPGDRTVYFRDDAGQVARLRISVPEGPSPEIVVRVAKKVQP
jgi:hypothetical protein